MTKREKTLKALKITTTALAITLAVIIVMLFLATFLYVSPAGRIYVENEKVENAGIVPFKDEFGYYGFTKTDSSNFRILQLTDTHIGNGLLSKRKDIKAFNAVKKLVAHTQTDLIVITGDVVYPFFLQSGSRDNLSAMKLFCEFMEKFEIPWTLAFGNHDAEAWAKASKRELCTYLETLKYCLFLTNDIGDDSLGNNIINLYNSNGELNTSLVLMDVSSPIKNFQPLGYYDASAKQVEWYETQLKRVAKGGELKNSIIFRHLPLKEYKTAWNLYKQGDASITYHFGSVGDPAGVSQPKYEYGLWNKIQELKSTSAIFVGHNHQNNFSLSYLGVRLTFGMSIDYIAYPGIENSTWQRGGIVIELDDDSDMLVSQVPLENIA